jgi:hypothetical protein
MAHDDSCDWSKGLGGEMSQVKRMVVATVIVLAAFAASAPRVVGAAPAKVQVKTLEFGYRLDTGKLRARVGLITGESLDFEVVDREAFFGVANVFASGHARLAAEIETGKVVALDVSLERQVYVGGK